MKKSLISKGVLYALFGLIVIYYSKDVLYPSGTIISRGSLGLLLLISTYYFVITLINSIKLNKGFYIVWTLFFMLNVVGYIFTGDINNSDHTGMLVGISATFLPFYPFYHFAQQGKLNPNQYITLLLLILPITIVNFHLHRTEVLLQTGRDDMVNNISYIFVYLIPLIFFLKEKKIISSILIAILFYYIILGSKRGAFITGFFGLMIFTYSLFENNRHKYYSIITNIVIISIIVYYSYYIFINNDFL